LLVIKASEERLKGYSI
jgi:hypothetical protein